MEDEPIVIVSGLPRSGTSLMMQMLAAGGVPIMTDALRVADASNPRGYFELEAVKKLRADKDWLDGACGHAIKIIHLLLRELPTDGGFTYRVLFMERTLPEVLASQRKMLERAGKPAADDAMLTKVFTDQLAQAKEWMHAHDCFSFLPVEHRRLLTEPELVAAEIARFLGRDLNLAAMAAAVDPALYRERQTLR